MKQESLAFKTSSLVKKYRSAQTPALDHLELAVPQGAFFGLLGKNGAGKTTAVSILAGLVRPDSGSASVLGYDVVKQATMVKRRIGLVPQEIALYENLSAVENLRFFGRMHGISGPALQQQVDKCLGFAGLTERGSEKVMSFSGGMKRRLNIAAGLIHEPRVLILDEPTVGVDTQSRHLIHQTLAALNRAGTTLLYTSHYLEEVEKLCSCIGIIERGKMVITGTPAELLCQTGHTSLEALFLHLTETQPHNS